MKRIEVLRKASSQFSTSQAQAVRGGDLIVAIPSGLMNGGGTLIGRVRRVKNQILLVCKSF